MTRTIKRDLSEIAKVASIRTAALQLSTNRLQELAAGHSRATDLLNRMNAHNTLYKALELRANSPSSLDIASRIGLDSLYSRVNEQLSLSSMRVFDDLIKQQNTVANMFKQSFAFENFNQLIMQAQSLQSNLAFQEILKNNSLSAFNQILSSHPQLSTWDRIFQEYEGIINDQGDHAEVEQHLDEIIDNLDTAITSANPKDMSFSEVRENIVALIAILTFLLMLFQTLQGEQNQERLVSAFEKQTDLFNLFMEQYSHQSTDKVIYVVKRSTPLSSEQSFNNQRLMWLHPTQEVEILDFDGKWVKVEAYDRQSCSAP